jgi:hypothetical protein
VNIKSFKYPCVISACFLVFIIFLILLLRYQTPDIERTSSISHLMGYVQTPIGGRPGTSDLYRPRLEELGIKKPVSIFGQTITQHQRGWDVYTGYEKIRAEGDTRLKESLTTYGRFIQAKTPLKAGIKFDWYRFGFAYPVYVWFGDGWEIAPAIELVVLDFGYRFKTPLLASGRTYRHVGVRIGGILKGRLDNQSVIWKGFVSIPGRLAISTFSHSVGQDYFPYLDISFKDSQPLPNWLSLGAKVKNEEVPGRISQNRDLLVGAQFIAPELLKPKSLDW